ncbi:M23 family metallopeptidase [Nocardioides campestrisoli]|uniref:M23 family metallopeptidase n=1 Tax=Nocardioides campestrisoli TaxID=2736757 RepID=UPI0015E705AB|nr:peptidoglycan DD-metalloendopeptidase family protein [Nocardioides campestrisoli]
MPLTHPWPRARATTAALGLATLALCTTALTAPAQSSAARKSLPVPTTSFQVPFTCAQDWSAGTRARHSPSVHSVDFNRAKDEGKAVVAAAAGRVTKADQTSTRGYGRHVVIDHGNGESTTYAHLKNVFVAAGSSVDQGTLIGAVGKTGNTTGAHLHFEQKVGRDVVPAHFRGVKLGYGAVTSGNCVDVPMAGNLAGTRGAEVAVFRRTRRGDFVVRQADGATPAIRFGSGTDEPVLGDWDGDGLVQPGTWNPRGRMFKLSGPAGTTSFRFGARGDRPVAGDWDGNGAWDVGVFRPRSATFLLRAASGAVASVPMGDADDVPVTGDWDGDGRTDVGVYDKATLTFTLRTVDPAGVAALATVPFGYPGDLPVTGDWDGNGTTDLGTWTPSTAVFNLAQAPVATAARTVATLQFGVPR